MSDIEWKDGAVCYAAGSQRVYTSEQLDEDLFAHRLYPHNYKDFQLNEIREGDFIPASELDTEQKYNEVVEVFGLFGITISVDHRGFFAENSLYLVVCDEGYAYTNECIERKLTYHQIIAIGKLKRVMLECEKSAPKTATDLTADKPKSAVDYLTECVEVQKQRGEQYDSTGTGERSFDAAAKAYNALTGGNIKGSDVCLILTCVKAVRQYSNPNRMHEDSLLDLVSYASLWAEELNKELK